MKLKTRLNVAKLNIDAVIPHNDEVWTIINTYFSADKWGIQFIYPTMADIPNRIWWGIQFVKNELIKIENEEHEKSLKKKL
jgi:hypothetical protein